MAGLASLVEAMHAGIVTLPRIPGLGAIYRDHLVYAGAVLQRFLESYVVDIKFDVDAIIDGGVHAFTDVLDIIIKNTKIFGGEWVFDPATESDDGLLGGRLQADVDEAGAGDLQGLHPGLEGRLGFERRDQAGGEFTRVGLQRLGQLHGGGAGEVAVGGLLGGFERRRGGRARGDFLERVGECGEQRLLGLDHGRDSRRPGLQRPGRSAR